MNWGKGITITLIAFIAFIVTLGVNMINADADLVSKDYYIKEVEYGSEIEAQKNAKSIDVQLTKEISNDGVMFTISVQDIDEGSIHLRRSNDPNMDVTSKLEGPNVFIDAQNLEKGKYDVIIDWVHEEKAFQHRDILWIP